MAPCILSESMTLSRAIRDRRELIPGRNRSEDLRGLWGDLSLIDQARAAHNGGHGNPDFRNSIVVRFSNRPREEAVATLVRAWIRV